MTQAPNGVDSQEVNAQQVSAQDWVTIWQSEWAAMAVDREVQEGLAAVTGAWNAALAAGADGSPGRAGTDAAAGAAPLGHAFGAGQPGERVA
jgi:hypothetical protein